MDGAVGANDAIAALATPRTAERRVRTIPLVSLMTRFLSSIARAGNAVSPRCLFLFTRSDEPCGVETFTRTLAGALASNDPGYELLSIAGRWRDLPAIFRSVTRADQIVFSFPLVAWKRML